MSKLFEMLRSLAPAIETQTARNEAYLAQSVDLYDLERRMAEIDRSGRETPLALTFAQGLR